MIICPTLHVFILISSLYVFLPFGTSTANNETETDLSEIDLSEVTSRSEIFDRKVHPFSIRFSKIALPKGSRHLSSKISLPLTAEDYPLKKDVAAIMKKSMCPSVTLPDDPELKYNLVQLINKVGGLPSHPSKDTNSDYWKQLREVVKIQVMRQKNGTFPARAYMTMPRLWKGYNLNQVAKAVHNEYPGLHQSELIQALWSQGARIDNSVIPKRSHNQFLHGIVTLAELNTWSIGVVGPYCFGAKYYAGRCRPEEIVWDIYVGRITEDDGVPADIVASVKKLKLKDARDFTAYKEGCPMHPSWPAMHSAASSSSLWLAVVLNLTREQRCQAMLTDYAVAYGRTIAGVHYPDDNIAGLKIGMEIVKRELPLHLKQRFGSDVNKVRRKIQRVLFDWDKFDGKNGC